LSRSKSGVSWTWLDDGDACNDFDTIIIGISTE